MVFQQKNDKRTEQHGSRDDTKQKYARIPDVFPVIVAEMVYNSNQLIVKFQNNREKCRAYSGNDEYYPVDRAVKEIPGIFEHFCLIIQVRLSL